MLGGHGHEFMMVVGVIEIVAGIGIALKPRIFGYVVSAWLLLIVINLLMVPGYLDVALRDLGFARRARVGAAERDRDAVASRLLAHLVVRIGERDGAAEPPPDARAVPERLRAQAAAGSTPRVRGTRARASRTRGRRWRRRRLRSTRTPGSRGRSSTTGSWRAPSRVLRSGGHLFQPRQTVVAEEEVRPLPEPAALGP